MTYHTTLDERIARAEKDLKSLKERVTAKQGTITELKLTRAGRDYGVTVGCVVVDNKGEEWRVTEIDPKWAGRPWLKGIKRNKDGKWRKAERHLYGHWKVI